MSSREERLAKNEALFRAVNERVRGILAHRPGHPDDARRRWEFVCECGDGACVERISLTSAEYEDVRASPERFAVVPGHPSTDVEEVVAQNERFAVVEKHPEWQPIARERYPR